MVNPETGRMNRTTPDGPHANFTERIIACAIAVHRELGPGLLESLYEAALAIELANNGIPLRRQVTIPVTYKGHPIGEHRLDLWVAERVVVEVKAVDRPDPVFEAQLITYLRLTGSRTGLLLNFNNRLLKDGIKRLVL